MNAKFAIACFAATVLLLPVAGHSADDKDSDRSSPKAFVKDSVITARIKAKMAKDRQVSAMRIHVDTDNKGVVTLSGNAKTSAEADRAVQIARATKGVVTVEDNIKVGTDR